VLPFTATGNDAEITLVACDRGLTDDHPDGMELWIRDFAVVRKDVYDSHQTAVAYPEATCYIPRADEVEPARRVGSVFDPSVAPAVSPQTQKFPFFDDFTDPAFSKKKWVLEGATIETVSSNDPLQPDPVVGPGLVLARVPADPAQNACSRAKVRVKNLKKGNVYVIDFKWETQFVNNAAEIDMLTFIDTDAK
jgi:hypothetical protein